MNFVLSISVSWLRMSVLVKAGVYGFFFFFFCLPCLQIQCSSLIRYRLF